MTPPRERPEPKPDIGPDDWLGSTDDVLTRLRRPAAPPKVHMDVALVVAAVLGAFGLMAAGVMVLRHDKPHRFEFLPGQTGLVFVLDRYSGAVAACTLGAGAEIACRPTDSPSDAELRRAMADLDAEIKAEQ